MSHIISFSINLSIHFRKTVLKKEWVNTKNDQNPYVTSARKWPLTYGNMYRQYRNNLTSLLWAAKNRFYKDLLKYNKGNPKAHF